MSALCRKRTCAPEQTASLFDHLIGAGEQPLSREACLTRQRFSRVSGTGHKVSAFKAREGREPFGLRLAAIALRRTVMLMLLYEMFAIGIAVALVVAAIGGLAARVMMGPEEMALLRKARAAAAQRRLVASAAQQKRDARAAAAQRRLVADQPPLSGPGGMLV